MDEAVNLFAGTYAGLVPLTYRPADDRLETGVVVPAAGSASYGVFDAVRRLNYLVDERDGGTVGVWRQSGHEWHCLLVVPSHGDAPCFVSLDAERRHLAVANYKSGHVAVYRLDDDGLPVAEAAVHAHAGSGPNADRQDGPHAHCVRFHGGWLYQTDLGTDEVLAYGPHGTRNVAFRAPAGQGPRHIVFHPRLSTAYLLTELGSRIFVLALEADGRFSQRQAVPTLPPGAADGSLGGHLAMNRAGDRLYASNRGHDSIAVFAVRDDGTVELMQIVPSHGQSPRFFRLLEDHGRILVAHQNGNSIACLAMNGDGTVAGLRHGVAVEQPAYIGRL